jgi:hypothetical protein
MKIAVFCNVTPSGSCKNRRFGGRYRFHHQDDKKRSARNNMCRLLVTANVVPSSSIRVTRMMEAFVSSETSVLTRATWRNIPEDGIFHSQFMFLP